MNHANGFTLIELMITVAVIGILSAIAMPSYNSYIIRGKLVEAPTQLADGRMKLEQFFQDYRAYDNTNSGTPPCSNASPLPSTKYFTFTCATTATTYTITASSQANKGLGAVGDYAYTIDQNNAKATTKFAGVASTTTLCWQMKAGDSC